MTKKELLEYSLTPRSWYGFEARKCKKGKSWRITLLIGYDIPRNIIKNILYVCKNDYYITKVYVDSNHSDKNFGYHIFFTCPFEYRSDVFKTWALLLQEYKCKQSQLEIKKERIDK